MSVVGRVQINRPGATGPVTPPTPPDDPPPPSYLDLIVADGAVAAWPLEESDATDTYADVIGSIAAVLSSGTTGSFADDPIGPSTSSSPHFLGLGTASSTAESLAIITPADALFAVGLGDVAMECWALFDAFPVDAAAGIAMYLGMTNLAAYLFGGLMSPDAPVPGAFRMSDEADGDYAETPPDYDDQALHHCVFTRRGGDYFVIIDGEEVAAYTPVSASTLGAGTLVSLAGIDLRSVVPGHFLYTIRGQLAWCAFYDVGLSGAQAAAHNAAGRS